MKSFVRSKRIRYLCIAVSFITLITLLIPSGNRGIVENQIYLLNPLESNSSANLPDIPAMVKTTSAANQSVLKRLHDIASKEPMDMGAQIGYLSTSTSPSLIELNAIFQRFPNQPAVCSAILIWAIYYDQGKDPDIMDFTIKVASQGERVDPDNAFFPFIMANAFYLHHDNKKGWLAFKRIENCKKWDTYVNDAVRDNARLVGMGYGYQSSLGRYFDARSIQNGYSFLSFSLGLHILMKKSRQQEIKLALKNSQNGYGHKEIAIQTLQERQIWSHLLGLVIQNPSSYGADRWGMATFYIAGCIGTQKYMSWLMQASKLKNDQRMQWILDKFATYTRSHPSGTGSRYSSENVSVFLREMKMEEIRDKCMAYLPALCLWWAIGAVTLALLLWIVLLGGLSYLFHPSGRLFSAKSGWASAGSIYLLSGIVLDEIGVWTHFDMRYVILLGICAVIFALIGMFSDTWLWRGIWIGGLIIIQEMLGTPEISLTTPEINISHLIIWWWVIAVVSCIVAIIRHFVRHRNKEKGAPTQKVSVMCILWRLVLGVLHGAYVFLVSMLVSGFIFGFLYISCYTLNALIFTTFISSHHLDVLYLWSDTFSNLYNLAQCYLLRSSYFGTSASIHASSVILFIIPLVIPILFFVGLLARKIRNHITLSSSMIGGIRKYGWWCAFLLLLVYGTLVLLTARRERIVTDALLSQPPSISHINNT